MRYMHRLVDRDSAAKDFFDAALRYEGSFRKQLLKPPVGASFTCACVRRELIPQCALISVDFFFQRH